MQGNDKIEWFAAGLFEFGGWPHQRLRKRAQARHRFTHNFLLPRHCLATLAHNRGNKWIERLVDCDGSNIGDRSNRSSCRLNCHFKAEKSHFRGQVFRFHGQTPGRLRAGQTVVVVATNGPVVGGTSLPALVLPLFCLSRCPETMCETARRTELLEFGASERPMSCATVPNWMAYFRNKEINEMLWNALVGWTQ